MAADKSPKKGAPETINFDDWEEVQVGFAPYWKAGEGESFAGYVVARDERDPEFVRYLIEAITPTRCFRGADENAENVIIKPGELFTVSVYHSLQEPFDFILENFVSRGDKVPMRLTAVKEVKTKKAGQTCWTWKMQHPSEYVKKIAAARDLARAALASESGERAAMTA